MADAFPRQILPYLEGQIGALRIMRFWSKVDIRTPEECWNWQAGLNGNGYGSFKLASYQTVTASRLALIINKRVEPAGMLVLHHCDNPPCCNPAHLYFGTNQQNMDDMSERGRGRTGKQSGAGNGAAKLTEEQFALVIARLKMGWGNTRVAADLPVSHSMISLIRLGRMWRPQAEALGWSIAA